jgi:hypothetical protein
MVQRWNDAPITALDEDRFERAPFARKVAELIVANHDKAGSTVYGLTGRWGSGKSSAVSMTAQALEETGGGWRIAHFTPWATNDVDGLLSDFYASLRSALPPKKGETVRKRLGALMEITASAATLLPMGGDFVKGALERGGTALREQLPWDAAFQAAADALQELNTPILLIVDDIDRLQADELLALMKVVRLLGRFPGLDYLLAYDEATLAETLAAAGMSGGDGRVATNFIEKIVQYPLVLPALLPARLLQTLNDGISQALAEAGRNAPSGVRSSRLIEVCLSQLPTPRAIGRYLAQLRYTLGLLDQDEVDDQDVIILTLLRTAFPRMYAELPRYRDELLRRNRPEAGSRSGTEAREGEFTASTLLDLVPPGSRFEARALLEALFPDLFHSQVLGAPGTRRVCTEPYFDRYFAMGILSHDIADAEMERAVRAAGAGDRGPLTAVLQGSSSERVVLALVKARQTTRKITPDQNAGAFLLGLLETLVGLLDQLENDAAAFANAESQGLVWAGEILTALPTETPHAEVFRVLTKREDSALPFQVVRTLDSTVTQRHWWPGVASELWGLGSEIVLENLLGQDDAPLQDGLVMVMEFLAVHGSAGLLRSEIARAIDEEEFTLADVAARFVSVVSASRNGDRRLDNRFPQDLYDQFVPHDPDSWYQEPAIDVDVTDVSWANRRAFATGRVKQPPSEPL